MSGKSTKKCEANRQASTLNSSKQRKEMMNRKLVIWTNGIRCRVSNFRHLPEVTCVFNFRLVTRKNNSEMSIYMY